MFVKDKTINKSGLFAFPYHQKKGLNTSSCRISNYEIFNKKRMRCLEK
jgi:hypothetical protein